MQLRDTAPELRRLQLDTYRAMSPGQRVALAFEMSEEIRQVAVEGIRTRNPSFDDDQVRRELLRILHGDALARLLSDARPPP